MRIFFAFLKEKRSFFLFVFASFLCYHLLFYLEGYDQRQLHYPGLLLLLFFLFMLLVMYIRFYRRYQGLRRLANGTVPQADALPKPSSAIDGLYTELFMHSLRQSEAQKNRLTAQLDETIENVGLWAHQIKTPLTALKIESKRADSRLFEIGEYVNSLMQFVRLSGTENDFVFEKIRLLPLVQADLRYLAPVFIAKGLFARLDIDENAVITSDSKWLSFVIRQILSNAVKYTKKGGVTIRFVDGILSIKDSGIGIRKEDLPRVFARSYTGRNGRIDTSASGLGLYLSKKVMDMLGHAIDIDSTPDAGTTLFLHLQNCKK